MNSVAQIAAILHDHVPDSVRGSDEWINIRARVRSTSGKSHRNSYCLLILLSYLMNPNITIVKRNFELHVSRSDSCFKSQA